MQIPVFDLKRQFQQIQPEIERNVKAVLRSGFYVLGPNVRGFEEDFSQYCGAKYAVALASGTDALILGLRALDIGRGDEVITTPFTFLSSAESIFNVGAKIVFADIDLNSYNIDPEQIERKITKKTKAILCVHLYGRPCNMQAIAKLARKYKLKLIEDCAQAAGAEYKGRKVGTFGDAGTFSFYPTKNLGACGDGGMVVSNSKQIIQKVKILREHGSASKYKHTIHGYNSRLDELQAAVLRVKLKYLDKWNQARRKIAIYYNKKLVSLASQGLISLPSSQKDILAVSHLYAIRVRRRTALMAFLKAKGIGTAAHYPIPLHLQKVYQDLGYIKGDFPNSELAAREIISLPLYPELNKKEIDYVVSSVEEFFRG